jgi:hypothetical protein
MKLIVECYMDIPRIEFEFHEKIEYDGKRFMAIRPKRRKPPAGIPLWPYGQKGGNDACWNWI